MYQSVNEFALNTIGISLNATFQILTILFVVGVVLWALLFTNYPPAHDTFHELRHALYVIPCH